MLKDHNKTAFIYQDVPVSYRELMDRTAVFTASYRVRKGERVAIFSENRPEWIYTLYSAWAHGAVAVPLDASLASADLASILRDAAPSIVFCSAGLEKTARAALRGSGIKARLIPFEKMKKPLRVPPFSMKLDDRNATAVIMYTSGTTGGAKGVMLSFDNLIFCIEGLKKLGMLTPEDVLIGLLPFHHIFPFQGTLVGVFYVGGTAVYVKNLVSDEILGALQKHGVTMFLGVPKLYELFHKSITTKVKAVLPGRMLLGLAKFVGSVDFGRVLFGKVHRAFGGKVHAYLTGGAKLDPGVAREMWAMGFRLVEGYGLTETSPLVAFNPFDRVKLGSVGKPLPGTEVRILDGEIVVRGRNVMKGYYNRPEETARALRGGWFHTGDLGAFDKDGYLAVTGRKDDMIVLPSGKNIDPEEIENRILDMSPLVKEIGVFEKGGRLAAIVYPDFPAIHRESIVNILETIRWKVIDRYNASVAGYKRIFHVNILKEELPRTRLGKLKRFMLRDAGLAHAKAASVPEPDYEEYRLLKKYLSEQVRAEVHQGDHLELDLGLDSLARVELQAFASSRFGVELDETTYASAPTVAGLAEIIRQRRSLPGGPERVDWRAILQGSEQEDLPRMEGSIKIYTTIASPILNMYFRPEIRGRENLPDGPCILVPNHQSFVDAPLLSAAMPPGILERTFFLARESLTSSRIMRAVLGRGNVIFVDIERDVRTSMRKAAAVIRAGMNLVIFPEGHRSRDGSLGAFKKAFAILARELDVPVVPVAIQGAFEALAHGSVLPRRRKVVISFMPPVRPANTDYQAFADRVRGMIARLFG